MMPVKKKGGDFWENYTRFTPWLLRFSAKYKI